MLRVLGVVLIEIRANENLLEAQMLADGFRSGR